MDIFTVTVSGVITLLLAGGIAAAAGYAVNWLNLPEKIKTAVLAVVVAGVSAAVVALANQLPQTVLDSRVIDLVIAGVSLLVTWAGQYAGRAKQRLQEGELVTAQRETLARATGIERKGLI